ncbi:spindle pole body component 110 [Ixodes scapularis]|nr:spindle pole body component 110 [Ixodes scapularis]
MITHACVRYQDDLSVAIVLVENIKDFKPSHSRDFVDGAKYSVKWLGQGSFSDDDEYYKARILLLGVSEADVKQKMDRRRMRIKKVLSSESSDNDAPEERNDGRKQEKKRMKEKQETSGRTNLAKLLEEKKKSMSKAHSLANMKPSPQRESEERHSKDQEQIKKLQSQLEEKDKELAQLRSLNMKLQERLLKQDEDKETSQPASHLGQCTIKSGPDHKKKCVESPQRFSEAAGDNLRERQPAPNENKVDLGQGIHLNRLVWEEVDRSGKDTIFVKELAVALYGPRELMERSAKGKHSPRYPGLPKKPAISPVKLAVIEDCYRERLQKGGMPGYLAGKAARKDVTTLINEKIADLRRKEAKRTEAAVTAMNSGESDDN